MTLPQGVKKVVSDGLGLVDFATGLVISILNLPDGQMKFFGGIQITEERYNQCSSKILLG